MNATAPAALPVQGWGVVFQQRSRSHWFRFDGRSLCNARTTDELRAGTTLGVKPDPIFSTCAICRQRLAAARGR